MRPLVCPLVHPSVASVRPLVRHACVENVNMRIYDSAVVIVCACVCECVAEVVKGGV